MVCEFAGIDDVGKVTRLCKAEGRWRCTESAFTGPYETECDVYRNSSSYVELHRMRQKKLGRNDGVNRTF